MTEFRPNAIGRGPAQVGAMAAIAFSFTSPFFTARIVIVAACPPPNTTNSLSVFWKKRLLVIQLKVMNYN